MKSFELFLSLLATIPDPRRAEGKLYQLPHVLLFSILAVASGANSYRGLRTFIRVHRQKLNEAFAIDWKKAPAHTSIRFILRGLKAGEVETAFRDHANNLNDDRPLPACALWRSTARCSRKASTPSTTPRRGRF